MEPCQGQRKRERTRTKKAGCRRHAEWQGGVVWPKRWDATTVRAQEASLTAINHHSLRSEFAEAAERVLAEA